VLKWIFGGKKRKEAEQFDSTPPSTTPPSQRDLNSGHSFEPEELREEQLNRRTQAQEEQPQTLFEGQQSLFSCRDRGVLPILIPDLKELVLYYRLAARYQVSQGELSLGLEFWSAYLKFSPGDGEAWYDYGLAQLRDHDPAGARQSLLEAQRICDEDPLIPAVLGFIARSEGAFLQAVEHYKRAVEKAPDRLDFQKELAEVQRAVGLETPAPRTQAEQD